MPKTTKKKLNQKSKKRSGSTPPRQLKRKAYRKSTKNYAKPTALPPRRSRGLRSKTTITYITPTRLKKRRSPKKNKPRLSVTRTGKRSRTRPRVTTRSRTRPRARIKSTRSTKSSYWIPTTSRRTTTTRLPLTTRAKSTRIKKRCPSDQELVCECVRKSKARKQRKARCRKNSKRNSAKCKSQTRPCYNAHKNTCSPPANAYY